MVQSKRRFEHSSSKPRDLLGGDQPDQLVRVRVEGDQTAHLVRQCGPQGIDDWETRLEEALKSSDYRIQFTEAFSGNRVTQFAPGGINRGLVKSAGGIDLKS
ncbi:MAG: hypothetical protein ABSA57_02390 [Candidatus Acidiferrales bacterium]|jgi:hypothetical protein